MKELEKNDLMELISLDSYKTPLTEKTLHKFTYEMKREMYFIANNAEERLELLKVYAEYIDFGEEI